MIWFYLIWNILIFDLNIFILTFFFPKKSTCELLYTFLNHTGSVLSFALCPVETGARLRGCVCSISQDKSVAIISLEEMKT